MHPFNLYCLFCILNSMNCYLMICNANYCNLFLSPARGDQPITYILFLMDVIHHL